MHNLLDLREPNSISMKFAPWLFISALFIAMTFVASCTKEGPPGPQGATGATGPSGGPVGPTGPTGPQGNAGTLVGYLTSGNWTSLNGHYYLDISWPAITQTVIDSGAVIAYVRPVNATYWNALPAVWFQQGYAESWTVSSYVGGLTVWQHCDDGILRNPGTCEFKIVLIAPGLRMANPDVDFTDYEEVAERFQLQELELTTVAGVSGT